MKGLLRIAVLTLLSFSLIMMPLAAAPLAIEAEGSYSLWGADTPENAEQWALAEAKMQALGNIAAYLEPAIKTHSDVPAIAIQALAAWHLSAAAGTVNKSIKVISAKPEIKKLTVKLKYSLDMEGLEQDLTQLPSSKKRQEYILHLAKVHTRYNQAIADNKKLQEAILQTADAGQRRKLEEDNRAQMLFQELQLAEKGLYYSFKGDYSAALASYRQSKLSWPEIHYSSGNAYLELKDFRQAVDEYTQAIQEKPDYAEAYCGRGHAYLGLEDSKAAGDDYDWTIAYNPAYAEAYFGRGIILEARGNIQDAIAEYAKAIQLKVDNPYYGIASYNLGNLFYNSPNASRRAMIHYLAVINNPAVNRDIKYIKAYINLSVIYYGQKQYAAILPVLERALAIDPNNAEAYYQRALAYEALGKSEPAQADYDKAAALNPAYAKNAFKEK